VVTRDRDLLCRRIVEPRGARVGVAGQVLHVYALSNRDPLDLIERNLILSPIIELSRPRRLVVGDVLRGFERSHCSSGTR